MAAHVDFAQSVQTHILADAVCRRQEVQRTNSRAACAAIHAAAGPELKNACRRHAMVTFQPPVRCPTGEARLTEGFALPARYVIHTVGPLFQDDETSEPLLQAAYRYAAVAFHHVPAVRYNNASTPGKQALCLEGVSNPRDCRGISSPNDSIFLFTRRARSWCFQDLLSRAPEAPVQEFSGPGE